MCVKLRGLVLMRGGGDCMTAFQTNTTPSSATAPPHISNTSHQGSAPPIRHARHSLCWLPPHLVAAPAGGCFLYPTCWWLPPHLAAVSLALLERNFGTPIKLRGGGGWCCRGLVYCPRCAPAKPTPPHNEPLAVTAGVTKHPTTGKRASHHIVDTLLHLLAPPTHPVDVLLFGFLSVTACNMLVELCSGSVFCGCGWYLEREAWEGLVHLGRETCASRTNPAPSSPL